MGGEFSRVNFSGGLFCWKKTESKTLTQEFGSKIRASKIRFQEFGPDFGSGGARSPVQTFVPDFFKKMQGKLSMATPADRRGECFFCLCKVWAVNMCASEREIYIYMYIDSVKMSLFPKVYSKTPRMYSYLLGGCKFVFSFLVCPFSCVFCLIILFGGTFFPQTCRPKEDHQKIARMSVSSYEGQIIGQPQI